MEESTSTVIGSLIGPLAFPRFLCGACLTLSLHKNA